MVDPGHPLRRIHNDRDRGFSAAVVVPLGMKSMIFVSGEIGRDSTGAIVPGDFETEVRQCFENIRSALIRAGAALSDVVRITAYMTDLSLYPVYAKVRTETFGTDWPASATVGVADLLLGAKLEVDAVAVVASSA